MHVTKTACVSCCSMTVYSFAAAPFSICTKEGVTSGSALSDGALSYYLSKQNYSNTGNCVADADCATGSFCNLAAPGSSWTWTCNPTTGLDTSQPLGKCEQRPCDKCQACLTGMSSRIRAQLNASSPNTDAVCTIDGCTSAFKDYLRGAINFGFRAGALCRALRQCTDLPTTCALRAVVRGRNITSNLDLCTAEGVVGGTMLSRKSSTAGCDCTAFVKACFVLHALVIQQGIHAM